MHKKWLWEIHFTTLIILVGKSDTLFRLVGLKFWQTHVVIILENTFFAEFFIRISQNDWCPCLRHMWRFFNIMTGIFCTYMVLFCSSTDGRSRPWLPQVLLRIFFQNQIDASQVILVLLLCLRWNCYSGHPLTIWGDLWAKHFLGIIDTVAVAGHHRFHLFLVMFISPEEVGTKAAFIDSLW